ncbi:MAG: WecB/TagA/CpsF family glycosyltransferase [Bacteroidales bacterium]|jgi:N-acetylglucosaminyldiphosphoundecaprenol N-acetyl-beta-D-mannosaminyltransferase|nr:WecB/TagA/CpsF family glycosyltransferase [Bacteroidales bacterium]
MNNFIINDIPVSIPENRLEIVHAFDECLEKKEKIYISFINPEIYMCQEKNVYLKRYLQQSKYNFVDGVGLLYIINRGSKYRYKPKDRYIGTDFFTFLPKDRNIRLFLFGARKGNLLLAVKNISCQYKNIQIVGAVDGFTAFSDETIVEMINIACADIVIVCLGCPKQELWIKKNINKINTKIIFGNGGSIDNWSYIVKRAPEFIRNIGFEWFYRLLQDRNFTRLKRQIKLTSFFIKILLGRYKVISIQNKYGVG